MKNLTFNEYCYKVLVGLYDPRFPEKNQCTGYLKLKEMVVNNITPASLEEIKRWETNPTEEEIMSTPDIKYLRFLHANLRPYIIENWNKIKQLKIK